MDSLDKSRKLIEKIRGIQKIHKEQSEENIKNIPLEHFKHVASSHFGLGYYHVYTIVGTKYGVIFGSCTLSIINGQDINLNDPQKMIMQARRIEEEPDVLLTTLPKGAAKFLCYHIDLLNR